MSYSSFYISPLDSCCGVLVCSHFDNKTITKENFISQIKFYFEDDSHYEYLNDTPHCYMATTNTENQPNVEKILTELGFTKTKFTGRDYSDLSFWLLTENPPEIQTFLENYFKNQEEE